jgi:hypothetical protein
MVSPETSDIIRRAEPLGRIENIQQDKIAID